MSDEKAGILSVIILIAGILLYTALIYSLSYFVIHTVPTNRNPHGNLLIRVTRNDEPIRGGIHLPGADYESDDDYYNPNYIYYSFNGDLSCAFMSYANPDRVNSIEIHDEAKTLLMTIPFDRYGIEPKDRLHVDLNTGEVISGKPAISFGQYFNGMRSSLGFGSWLSFVLGISLASLILLAGAFCAIMTPFAFVLMFLNASIEKKAGVKRRFSGSYVHLVFCLFMSVGMLAMFFFDRESFNEIFFDDSAFVTVVMGYWLLGTVFYFFAHRQFDAAEVRAARQQKTREDFINANNFKYTVSTREVYRDGILVSSDTSSDLVPTLVVNNAGMVIGWIIKMLIAPFAVPFIMIKNHLFGSYWLNRRKYEYDVANEAAAILATGYSYVHDKDFLSAFPYLEAAAQLGSADGQTCLGHYYMHGHGVVTPNRETAMFWYDLAARQGDKEAAGELMELRKPTESVNLCKTCGAKLSGIGKFCATCGTPV